MVGLARLPREYGKHLAWWGELTEETGYAQEGRLLLQAITDIGFTAKAIPLSADKIKEEIDPSYRTLLRKYLDVNLPQDYFNIVHWGGTQWWPNSNPVIWRTMFETDSLPPDWVKQSLKAEEVWIPSQFNVDTFAKAGVPENKLRLLNEPIDTKAFNPVVVKPLSTIPSDKFSFLSVFMWQERKGWDVLLKAYNQAFSKRDDVLLVLHINNFLSTSFEPHEAIAQARRDAGKLDDAPQVMITPSALSVGEMPSLYRACNAFVLPSRGEGCGRPYLEAMCMGLPTIGTGWSGNTEFMKEDNSFLLDYEIRKISSYAASEWPVYYEDHSWAEPSVEHLISVMREVFDNKSEAEKKGAKASIDVRSKYDTAKIAQQLKG